jgi:hypothetical protein
MQIKGEITSGNYARQALEMTGPTTIRGGNFLFARITTNGFPLIFAGGNKLGVYIDGVKDDDFELKAYVQLDSAVLVLAELGSGGADARRAWETAVDIIHAQAVRLTEGEFKAAYAAVFTGLTYSGAVIAAVERGANVAGWDNVQDYIANHSKAQLMGDDTEMVGVES